MAEITIDQPSCWRCPVCTSEMAAPAAAVSRPPRCRMGHREVEMEQVAAEGFAATLDAMREDDRG